MDSTKFLMPYATDVMILDPAPRRANPAQNPSKPAPSQPNSNTIPGPSAAASRDPLGGPSPDVVQEYRLSYRLFLKEARGFTIKYTLAVPLSGAKPGYQAGCVALSVCQQDEVDASPYTWDVRVLKEGAQPIPAPDGGPNFEKPVIYSVTARDAELREDGSFKPQKSIKVLVIDARARAGPLFQVFGAEQEFVFTMIVIKLSIKRRFSRENWNYFSNERTLSQRRRCWRTRRGLGSWFFWTRRARKCRPTRRSWSTSHTLRPSSETSGRETQPGICITSCGDILSLADACGVPALCADVILMVLVTSSNMDSWLAWLLKEHGVDASPIKKQVVKIMRDDLQNGLRWDELSVEQLSNVAALQRSLTMPIEPRPEIRDQGS